MAFVSVTRLRLRAVWLAPPLFLAAQRAIAQAQRATGFLGGALLPERRFTFWTLTTWESEAAMRAYMLAGPHRAVMPKLTAWCDEASVVHWEEPQPGVPALAVAAERMRREGRPSNLRRPSPRHLSMTYDEPRLTGGAPITPLR